MSNAASWNEVMAPVMAHRRNIVLRETWGHLAPKKNISYKCKILFSVSGYDSGTRTIIDTELAAGLEDSPWLYESIDMEVNKWKIDSSKVPGVYLIVGTFRNFRWYGKPKLVYSLSNPQS